MTQSAGALAWIASVIAVLPLMACERGGSTVEGYVTVDTLESGALRVSSSLQTTPTDSRARLVEDLRIGAAEGAGPTVFGRIAGLEVGEDDRIYVLDAFAGELRIFDRVGQHIRTFGREGSGPEELRRARGMAWDPAGRLWVVDSGNARYTILDRDGNLLGHVPRPGGVGSTYWPGTIDSRGDVWELKRLRSPELPAGVTERVLARVSSSGEILDSFPLPRHELKVYEGVGVTAAVPFTSTQHWAVDRAGAVWLGTTGNYRLVKLQPPSDTLMIIEKDYESVPVTSAERDAILESDPGLRSVRAYGGVVDPSLIPSVKPSFIRFALSGDGTVWVWPSTPATGPTLIDVFDPDGHYRETIVGSQVALSPRPVIDRDYLVAVVVDELGVERVARYRIER